MIVESITHFRPIDAVMT